ncbi:MAG: YigZ family protein [Clostridia bacterium]|nr:YigZ family protein [Clostridia bacterium]
MAKDKKKKAAAEEESAVPELFTTVEREGVAEFEERKSVFIGHCIRVSSEEEANAYVKQMKKRYADARHNVWAYLLRGGIVARYSDDGEPQGTAGVPILDVLRKSGAEDVCMVVTRYFGGILLGAGGLVRAYSHTASLALAEAHIVTYERYDEIEVRCSYSDYQKLSADLPAFGAIVDGVDFADDVLLRFALKQGQTAALFEKIREMSAGRLTPAVTGTRFDHD